VEAGRSLKSQPCLFVYCPWIPGNKKWRFTPGKPHHIGRTPPIVDDLPLTLPIPAPGDIKAHTCVYKYPPGKISCSGSRATIFEFFNHEVRKEKTGGKKRKNAKTQAKEVGAPS